MKGGLQVSLFKLSNHIFNLGLTAKELSVYAYLCSLPSVQNTIDDKAVVKVKQTTIAENCCIKAAQTVSAIITRLAEKGVIDVLERSFNAVHHKATYTYAVKKLSVTTEYFFVDRQAFGKLNTRQMAVYLFLCKAYDHNRRDSWNSYNDISNTLHMKRENVIQTVSELVVMKFIVRMKRKSKENRKMYVDNHYQLITYVVGHIRKKGIKKVCMHSDCIHTLVMKHIHNERDYKYYNSLIGKSQYVFENFFHSRGSP